MIDENTVNELTHYTGEAKSNLAMLLEWDPQTPEDLIYAGKFLREANSKLKLLEDRREEITKPMNTALKSIRSLFKPPVDTLTLLVSTLKQKIATGNSLIATRNRAAMQEAATLMIAKDVHGAALAASTMTVKPTLEGVRTQEVLEFVVETPDEVPEYYCTPDINKILASKDFVVPRHLCSPDMAKLQAQLKAHGDKMNVPGVRVVINTRVVASRLLFVVS